jgi:hypothetical protein
LVKKGCCSIVCEEALLLSFPLNLPLDQNLLVKPKTSELVPPNLRVILKFCQTQSSLLGEAGSSVDSCHCHRFLT